MARSLGCSAAVQRLAEGFYTVLSNGESMIGQVCLGGGFGGWLSLKTGDQKVDGGDDVVAAGRCIADGRADLGRG